MNQVLAFKIVENASIVTKKITKIQVPIVWYPWYPSEDEIICKSAH